MIARDAEGRLTEYRIGLGGGITHWRPLADERYLFGEVAKALGCEPDRPEVHRIAMRGLTMFDHPIPFRDYSKIKPPRVKR